MHLLYGYYKLVKIALCISRKYTKPLAEEAKYIKRATLLNWNEFLLPKLHSYGEGLNLRGAMVPDPPTFTTYVQSGQNCWWRQSAKLSNFGRRKVKPFIYLFTANKDELAAVNGDSVNMVQITHNLNSTGMSHACSKANKMCCIKLHVNKCTTHMHVSISICHETILLITSSALSFIIYACRTILGGVVTNKLRHLTHRYCICSRL